jgi:hypothetical protein
VNHALIGSTVKLVNIQVEAISDKHVPIAGDPVKDVTSAGAGDAEQRVTVAGIDQDREIILRDECHRPIVGQIDSIHPKSIRPARSNFAGISLKDVEL